MLFSLLAVLLASQVAAQTTTVRVCVTNGKQAEAAGCTAWLRKALAANSTVNFECVYEASEDLCLQRVSAGNAELVRGGGNTLYQAGRDFNFVAYVSEDYGDTAGASYYSVAVVKKSFCDARNNDVTLRDLKWHRACSTGYRRTAGWTLPVGYLISRRIMPVVSAQDNVQDDAESFENWFSDVCAPGTTDGEGNAAGPTNDGTRIGKPHANLCAACTRGKQNCTAQSGYWNYGGALRCLIEDAGEVAFVKHTTPFDFAPTSKDRQPWSISPDDLRLVCADNSGCRPVTAWSTCGMARAPAHALVGKPASSPALEEASRILVAASANAAWVREGITFSVLSADAAGLRPVRTTGRPVTIPDLMGPDAHDAFDAIRRLQDRTDLMASDGGLSAGAIAGIVVGAVVGTALLATVIAIFVIRHNKKKSWEEFCRQHDSQGINMNAAKPSSASKV